MSRYVRQFKNLLIGWKQGNRGSEKENESCWRREVH